MEEKQKKKNENKDANELCGSEHDQKAVHLVYSRGGYRITAVRHGSVWPLQ